MNKLFSLFLKALSAILLSTAFFGLSAYAASQSSLIDRRHGFAQAATGGMIGATYIVTSDSDTGPGTLREALEDPNPLWITFSGDMTINLATVINLKSNKTIDGRDHEIVLKNRGLYITDAENIIISNIAIVEGDSTNNANGLNCFDHVVAYCNAINILRSNTIWIDHVTLAHFGAQLLNITNAHSQKTRVTVSNSKFLNHDKSIIIGLHLPYAPNDSQIYVTLSQNYFAADLNQRNPRVSQAYVHMYNNVVNWSIKGVQSYDTAKVLSEKNWYIAPTSNINKQAISHIHGGNTPSGYVVPEGYARSVGDKAENGAIIEEYLPNSVVFPDYDYCTISTIESNKSFVTANAGSGYNYTTN